MTEISGADVAGLEVLASILHLFHHRNKNQHRRSTWWRHFSHFRRQLQSLILDITRLRDVPTTHVARAKKKTRDEKVAATVEQRLAFWQDVMVSKWQHAFSQVAADGRFATLGLVLTAVLSQACQILGLTAKLEDLGQIEVEKVLHQFARESLQEQGRSEHALSQGGEDAGEVVQRITHEETMETPASGQAPDSGTAATEPANQNDTRTGDKRRKDIAGTKSKKRRKGDAIDDLFSGLG